jgi:hypothetical protein
LHDRDKIEELTVKEQQARRENEEQAAELKLLKGWVREI